MQITAAVFREVHQPLTIETVDMDMPRGREVLVRTVATGVCHSDLHIVDGLGRFNLDRPFVLGHEGSGVVEAVGTILAMNGSFVPPTLNVRDIDPACNLDVVAGEARPHPGRAVLANAFGFGGNNASLLLRTINDVEGPA